MSSINRNMKKAIATLLFIISVTVYQCLYAQNPLITDQFTADPSARVFDGKVYVYPSHDIPCGHKQGYIGFCMADYHVFSSENLTDWTDHGVILSQDEVLWADSASYSMWAPDCIFKDGKYYFYFNAIEKGKLNERGRRIGVAVSDKPIGPFIPEEKPMEGLKGIDPNPFIDKDGKPYLYWADRSKLMVAGLSDDMLSIITVPRAINELPKGFKEGPYLFERNGIYYFTFPLILNKTEELAYATGDNPMGPFTYRGIIMDESPWKCWTNHHSIIEYNNQWYLFYHHNDLSPRFDKNRSIKADSLFFRKDGAIIKVNPSHRGVGITNAARNIQIDRYSGCSAKGVRLSYVDNSQKMQGWKVTLFRKNAWVRYNKVSFDGFKPQSVKLKGMTDKGGLVTIRMDRPDGPVITQVKIPKSKNWEIIKTTLTETPAGIHDLYIMLNSSKKVKIDWISFEQQKR